jgi:hypothetical protein
MSVTMSHPSLCSSHFSLCLVLQPLFSFILMIPFFTIPQHFLYLHPTYECKHNPNLNIPPNTNPTQYLNTTTSKRIAATPCTIVMFKNTLANYIHQDQRLSPGQQLDVIFVTTEIVSPSLHICPVQHAYCVYLRCNDKTN